VIWDDKGNFLAASNEHIDFALDAATMKALVIKQGLYWKILLKDVANKVFHGIAKYKL
jgi:hypothetical protein